MQRSLKWPPYNCVLCLYLNMVQTFARLKVSVYVKRWAKALFYPKAFHLTDQPELFIQKALHLNLWHIKWLMKLLAGVLLISNIQKNLAIWAILLLLANLANISFSQISVTVYVWNVLVHQKIRLFGITGIGSQLEEI
jgi:hypothetical protein